MSDHQPARRILRRHSQRAHQRLDGTDMTLRLLEVLLPLLLEFLVQHAGQGRFVDLDAADLGLQHLLQQFVALFDIHKPLLVRDHPWQANDGRSKRMQHRHIDPNIF